MLQDSNMIIYIYYIYRYVYFDFWLFKKRQTNHLCMCCMIFCLICQHCSQLELQHVWKRLENKVTLKKHNGKLMEHNGKLMEN